MGIYIVQSNIYSLSSNNRNGLYCQVILQPLETDMHSYDILICYVLVYICLLLKLNRWFSFSAERMAGSWVNTSRNLTRKPYILTSMVTLSFLLFWGPYYVVGIYDWIVGENDEGNKLVSYDIREKYFINYLPYYAAYLLSMSWVLTPRHCMSTDVRLYQWTNIKEILFVLSLTASCFNVI